MAEQNNAANSQGTRAPAALITGASRGIGKALAIGLAGLGYDIALADLDSCQTGLRDVEQQITAKGQTGRAYTVDVSRKSQVVAMIERASADFGQIDLLVNNAGILKRALLEDLDEHDWDQHFDVNVKGVFLMCQAITPYMKKRRAGRIVNVASIAARGGAVEQGHYASTKGAVVSLTRVLAKELGPFGITVNAICPGIILTEMGRNNLGDDAAVRHWETTTALRRLGQPEDLVGAVYFFASPHADFITGQALNVDGGIRFN
ncbi:SDR family NAD(P)-dependent oxidoreductase [Salinisphaera sp. T31B1]|uniref:SDR family NAD(P)-dependent oxidoreductase n=1 Tax=Salinisphaera sp. T31B1 TaxID=727963 RepID=UPI0033408D06